MTGPVLPSVDLAADAVLVAGAFGLFVFVLAILAAVAELVQALGWWRDV